MSDISMGFKAPISRIYYSAMNKQIAISMDGVHGGFVTLWVSPEDAGKLTSQIVEAYVEMLKHQTKEALGE